jgi:hypothetical protein
MGCVYRYTIEPHSWIRRSVNCALRACVHLSISISCSSRLHSVHTRIKRRIFPFTPPKVSLVYIYPLTPYSPIKSKAPQLGFGGVGVHKNRRRDKTHMSFRLVRNECMRFTSSLFASWVRVGGGEEVRLGCLVFFFLGV